MTSLELRSLRADERELLQVATLGNLNWCGERFAMHDVVTRPEFAHYTQLHPERGDFGVVGSQAATIVGVCWAQFMPAHDPGYGFVDADTPELSVWVAPEYRASGHGHQLLDALITAARDSGVARISLSVEDGNHAKALYESLGFVPVTGRETDGVMLLHL